MVHGFSSAEKRRMWATLMEAIDQLPTADVPCQSDPDLFFFDEELCDVTPWEANNMAKALCASCPVKFLCAEYAIADDVRYGVWGGLTPSERSAVRRERKL